MNQEQRDDLVIEKYLLRGLAKELEGLIVCYRIGITPADETLGLIDSIKRYLARKGGRESNGTSDQVRSSPA